MPPVQSFPGVRSGTAWRAAFRGARRLPLLLQSEAAECGLACLGMIAGYFGHHCDLPGLRGRCAHSARGATLQDLIRWSSTFGLQARALKLSLEQLPQLQRPCILHWDMNHFVVLKSAG